MATKVSGLYRAEAAVAGVEASQRSKAIRQALVKVLVKVTGNRKIASRKALAGDIKNASRYVQQYSYQLAKGAEVGSEGEPQRYLLVSFDRLAIDRLLREQGLPVWSENRPSILSWTGVERRGRRRLTDSERDAPVRSALEKTARARGLPLLFPLMDLEDQGRLQIADLWGDFETNIRSASNRYRPDVVLTGRLVQVAKTLWRGDWRLYQGDQVSKWESETASQVGAAVSGMQHAADLLADRFAPVREQGGLSTVRLRVSGISSLDAYTRMGRLLESQSSLERAVIVTVDPDTVTYDLHGLGGTQALEQGLEVGGLIEPDADATFTSEDESVDLYFRMR